MKLLYITLFLISFCACTTRVPYANKIDDLPHEGLKLDPIWDYKLSPLTYAIAGGYAGAGLIFIKQRDLKFINLLVPLFGLAIVGRGNGVTVNGKRTNSVKYKHYDEWLSKLNKKNNKDYVFAEKEGDYVVIVPRYQIANYLKYKTDQANMYRGSGSYSDFWSTAIMVGGSAYILYKGYKLFFGQPSKSSSPPREIDGQLQEDQFCDFYLCLSYTCNQTGKMVRIRKVDENSESYEVGVDSSLEKANSFQNALDIAIKQTNCY